MMYLKCKKNHFILELPEHTTIKYPPQLQKESTTTLKMEAVDASKTQTIWCHTPENNTKSY